MKMSQFSFTQASSPSSNPWLYQSNTFDKSSNATMSQAWKLTTKVFQKKLNIFLISACHSNSPLQMISLSRGGAFSLKVNTELLVNVKT